MIQLTEQEARKLLSDVSFYNALQSEDDEIIEKWKEKGYIKKSKLEEAREYYIKILPDYNISNADNIMKLQELYEEAIKEILEDKK